jgi:creatinine amidohydrolase
MTEPTLLRWETLTKRKFDQLDRANCVVLVTCSPLEVHGPHLPFGADILEGEGLSRRMLGFLPERHRARTFLQLPFIYAATDTLPHPGSIFFHPSTTQAVLRDLGRSLAAQGFENVVVSNFHGSPRHFLAIETACERVSAERDVKMVSIFSLMLSRLNRDGGAELGDVIGHLPGLDKADLEGDTHGGLVETSQLLALHPEWVDPDYKDLPRRTVDLWLEETGRKKPASTRGTLASIPEMVAGFKAGIHYFARDTYAGAPGRASAELGEQIMDILAEKSAAALAEILDGTLPRDQWHSPFWKLRHVFVNRAAVRFFDWVLNVPRTVSG